MKPQVTTDSDGFPHSPCAKMRISRLKAVKIYFFYDHDSNINHQICMHQILIPNRWHTFKKL